MIDFAKVSESIAHELEVAALAAPIFKELDRLRNAISGTALQIGEQLKKLHGIYSPARFSRFMRRDLPGDHGISRSTGYRWMVSAEKLSDLFPNRVVRDELMLRSDARGIFVDRGKDRNNLDDLDPAHASLTPAAQEALSTLSAPPKDEEEYESRQWARNFIKAMNRARARQRAQETAARRTPEKEQEAILRKLKKFAENFGTDVASQLRDKVNRVLDLPKQDGKCESNETALQSQNGIGAESTAAPRKQAPALEQPLASRHQTESDPSPSNVSPSQSLSQSQLRTETALPAARAKKRAKKRPRPAPRPQAGSGYAGYIRKILAKR
jgi:hypothetical protein